VRAAPFGPQAVAPVVVALNETELLQRREQPQHGALVLLGAACEVGERQGLVAVVKGLQQHQGAIDRHHAAGRSGLLGVRCAFGQLSGLARHGLDVKGER